MSAEQDDNIEFEQFPDRAKYQDGYTSILVQIKKQNAYLEAVRILSNVRDSLMVASSSIDSIRYKEGVNQSNRESSSFYNSLSLNENVVKTIGDIQGNIEANKRMCVDQLSPPQRVIEHIRQTTSYRNDRSVTALYIRFLENLNNELNPNSSVNDLVTGMTQGDVVARVLRTLSKGEKVTTISELLGEEKGQEEQTLKSIEEFTSSIATKGEAHQQIFTLANIYVGLEEAQLQLANSEYAQVPFLIPTWRNEIKATLDIDPDFETYALAASQAETVITHLTFVNIGGTPFENELEKGLALGLKNKFGKVTRTEAVAYVKKLHSTLLEKDIGLDQEAIGAVWAYINTIGNWMLGADYESVNEKLRIKNNLEDTLEIIPPPAQKRGRFSLRRASK